jgi:hypothetical protein
MWGILMDEPPQFFPLNNPQGTYVITKNCPSQGWEENTTSNTHTYCVNYKGSDVFMNEEHGNKNFFSVMVGKSTIDLKEFEDKPITSIQGKFVGSSKQCIVDQCTEIGGPFVLLNITSVSIR